MNQDWSKSKLFSQYLKYIGEYETAQMIYLIFLLAWRYFNLPEIYLSFFDLIWETSQFLKQTYLILSTVWMKCELSY